MNIHITIKLALKFAFISTIVSIVWWCLHTIICRWRRRNSRVNINSSEHEASPAPAPVINPSVDVSVEDV